MDVEVWQLQLFRLTIPRKNEIASLHPSFCSANKPFTTSTARPNSFISAASLIRPYVRRVFGVGRAGTKKTPRSGNSITRSTTCPLIIFPSVSETRRKNYEIIHLPVRNVPAVLLAAPGNIFSFRRRRDPAKRIRHVFNKKKSHPTTWNLIQSDRDQRLMICGI